MESPPLVTVYLLETRSLVITVWNGGVENESLGLDRSTSVSEPLHAAWAMGVPCCVSAICLWQAAHDAVPANSSRVASALVGHQPCPRSRCEVSWDISLLSALCPPAGFHSASAATRTKTRISLGAGPDMVFTSDYRKSIPPFQYSEFAFGDIASKT